MIFEGKKSIFFWSGVDTSREQQTGNKAESDSMKARLQRKQQEMQERENSRQSHQHKNDRGAR